MWRSLLPKKAANTSVMRNSNHIMFQLLHFQHPKSLMLHCQSFLWGGSNTFTSFFANKGSQYIEYGLMLFHGLWIAQDKRPKLIHTPLTFIFGIRQQVCCFPFYLSQRQIRWLWKVVTMQPFDSQSCKTKNCWCPFDAHLKHILTVIVCSIIGYKNLYSLYWQPKYRFNA